MKSQVHGPRRVLDLERAITEARRIFARTGTLDVQELTQQLSVSRATLYRVVGTRDRLLGEVISSLAEITLEAAIEGAHGEGIDRIIDIARRFNEQVVAFKPLRQFLEREPITAMRVLFTPAGDVHRRSVERWKVAISQVVATDNVTLPFEEDDFVYVFVRVGESMLFADLISGRSPDVELAELVERALFAVVNPPT
jgi:AcrR family transcriptional regulator